MNYRITCLTWLCLSLAAVTSVQARCVEVALIGDSGQVVVPDGLVVGMLLGETPVFDVPLQPHREKRVLRDAECPPALKAAINELYNRSCTSDTARQQVAETNQTSMEIVLKGCADMRTALRSAR